MVIDNYNRNPKQFIVENVIRAWQKTAVELNLKVHTPFTFFDDEESFQYQIVIENFGSKKGVIVMSMNEVNDKAIPEKLGVFYS